MKRKWDFLKGSISYLAKSISTKVIIVILILIFPLNIFTIILSEMALNNIISQTKLSVTNVMQNYLTDTEERMEHLVSLLYSMKTNDTDGMIVSRQKADHEYNIAKYRFFNNIRSSLLLSKTADGAFMYMSHIDDILLWNMDTRIHSIDDMKEFVRGLSGKGILKGWHLYMVPGEYRDEQDYAVLWLFTEQQGVYSGGWIELDSVADKLRNDLQYKQVEVLFTEDKVEAESNDELVVSSYFERAGIYLTVKLNSKEINGTILSIYLVMRKIAITALILLPFLYYLLYRLLLLPLWRIYQAHREIEAGNQDYRITHKATSIEYSAVYDSFNRMADNIKNLKIENYEQELKKQRVELKNLQLQIRPHFLMNAFNLIYTLAQERDVTHIQEIMLYLSDYFRYIFRNEKELELFGKEQKLIEGYINMAQIRYPESIVVTYDYDPEVSFVRLPPLLLHNFVENIIKHVVKQGTVTHISLEGRYGSGLVTFQVSDDGSGMDKEQLSQVDQRMRQGEITGSNIGMANAYRRLKYFYGEDADIEIISEEGHGTNVIIHFPYDLDEESENC